MFLSHLGENCGILFLLYQAKKADNVPECAGEFFSWRAGKAESRSNDEIIYCQMAGRAILLHSR